MATRHKIQDVGKQNYTIIAFVKWEISFICKVRNEKKCEESVVQ